MSSKLNSVIVIIFITNFFIIIIIQNPLSLGFHRLHWPLLQNSFHGHLLIVQIIVMYVLHQE